MSICIPLASDKKGVDTAKKLLEQALAVQIQPPVWVLIFSFLLALTIVLPRPAWKVTRNAVTIVHEGGHALAAVLTGRRLAGIKLHSDTSGVTTTAGNPTGPGMILTAFSGYPAPALIGFGAAVILGTGRPIAVLYISVILLVIILTQIRNFYGLLTVTVTGGLCILVARYAPDLMQGFFAYFLVWFLLLAGFRPVIELQRKRRMKEAEDSDADQLARLTGLPGIFWVGIFLLVSGGALIAGAFRIVGLDLPFI